LAGHPRHPVHGGDLDCLRLVTATLAAWFLEKVRGQQEGDQGVVLAELRALRQEVAELRRERFG
jgi:hypothetical protein